jgi:RNA recognition motif-containing protein
MENKAEVDKITEKTDENIVKKESSSLNLTSLFSEQSSTNSNLYVCNIPEKWNIKELESLFSQYGKVLSCRIMYDKYTGQSRRIGFVKFDTRQQSDEALKSLNGKIPKSSSTGNDNQGEKVLVVKYANNSNYLSILTSIAADIAAVHGINPNEILTYISHLYFPTSNSVPLITTCKTRKNLVEIIESKFKSYFGNENAEIFKNELKTNSKESLTKSLSSIVNQNKKQQIPNNNTLLPNGKTSNTNQHLYATASLNKLPSLQVPYIPVVNQHQMPVAPQPFINSNTKTGWSIFVYNLPPKCDECLLWKLFNPFGPVLFVHVTRDNKTNKCKGHGIVTMTNYDQAIHSVYVLNGLNLPGSNKPLHVSLKMNN